MTRLRKTGRRISAAGWGLVLVACEVVDVVRRRSLLSAMSAAMLATLLVIVLPGPGGGNAAAEVPDQSSAATGSAPESAAEDKFLELGGYSINLPDGWRTSPRPPGAAFAASSGDGLATATLWIRRNPGLSFHAFERRSERSLSKLGENVSVVSEVKGATMADSSVELSAEVPIGSELIPDDQELISVYRVTLRGSGPYRYYLATQIQPGAPAARLAEAEELAHGLRPWLSDAS